VLLTEGSIDWPYQDCPLPDVPKCWFDNTLCDAGSKQIFG
jgi:hypothetical protein